MTALLVGLMVAPAGAAEAVPEIDLSVTKTDTMDPVQPGDTFDYVIDVTNSGPSGAFAVYATDVLPDEVTFVSASRPECVFDGGSVVECALGAFTAGQSKSFSITVAVKAGTPEITFTNIVMVENREDPATAPVETDLTNNRADEDTTVVLGSIGDTVWFDTNSNGVQDSGEPGLAGITVELDGPGGPQSTSTDADGKYLFDDLLRGDYEAVVTGPARHDATTPTTHAVDLGMGEDYPDADFGFVQIDLELTKTVDPDTVLVTPGSPPFPTTTFTVSVVNQGPGDATGVVVGDVLPAGLVYVSDDGGGAFDPTTFEWTIGALANQASTSLSFVVEVTDVGEFTNVAEVIAADQIDVDSEPGDGMGDDYDEATVSAGSIVLAGGLGDTVWYDINGNGVQNSGEPGIAGVQLTISLTDGSTATATTDSNGKYSLTVDPGTHTVTVDKSTVSIVIDGVTVSGGLITPTTPTTRTGDVPDNGENLTFDFGFTVPCGPDVLPCTGFTSSGVGITGAVVLLLGAGLLLLSRRGKRILDGE